MKFTDRMGLKMPDQDDAYQVDDFNSNVKKISEYFAAKPVLTPYKDLAEFIRSGKAAGYKLGDTVAIHDIIYRQNLLYSDCVECLGNICDQILFIFQTT